MALTSGEKQNKATVSSIQSRMGVVDAYGEDAIGLAAKNASAVLDVFAEREANKEEVAYKTDLKLKSRQTLLELSRKHYDDPDGFTKATNSYINTLVEKAPNRFKDYAKSFTGNIAFEYGDKIFQEAKAQKDVLVLDSFNTNHSDFISQRNTSIMNLSPDEMQSYWTENLLPEISDTMVDYEKLYNSYPAAIQQQLAQSYGTPDSVDKNGNVIQGTFNKTLLMGFETQRLISLAKQDLDAAQLADSLFIQSAGGIPANYITEVSKINAELQKWGINYLDNPLHDKDDASVYKDTNREERAVISTAVNEYIQSWNSANEKNVKKQEIILDQDKKEVVENTIVGIKDGNVFESVEDIRVLANQYNLNMDQLNELVKENTLMKAIQDISKQITYFDSGKIVTTMNKFNVDQLINSRVRTLNNKFGEGTITVDKLKDEAMMQQMYELVQIEFGDEMTRNVFNNMPMSTIAKDGASSNNLFLTSLLELSKTYGAVPDKLEQYFASAGTFDFEQPNDIEELRNMAQFANNLSITPGRAPAFSSDEANYLFPHLLELHKEFERMGRLDINLANRTEKEINDILGKNTIGQYQSLVVEKWISGVYPEQTILDDKILYMNQVIQDSGLDVNEIMYDFFKDREEDGPWWGLFFTDQDLLTGNVEFNLFGDDKDLEPSFRLVLQEAKEMFDMRVASMFGSTYKSTMTESTIKENLKKQLPYILNTIRTAGYGPDENG
jgi:hypothetical protein